MGEEVEGVPREEKREDGVLGRYVWKTEDLWWYLLKRMEMAVVNKSFQKKNEHVVMYSSGDRWMMFSAEDAT